MVLVIQVGIAAVENELTSTQTSVMDKSQAPEYLTDTTAGNEMMNDNVVVQGNMIMTFAQYFNTTANTLTLGSTSPYRRSSLLVLMDCNNTKLMVTKYSIKTVSEYLLYY